MAKAPRRTQPLSRGESAPLNDTRPSAGINIRPSPTFLLFFLPGASSWDVVDIDGKPCLVPVLRVKRAIAGGWVKVNGETGEADWSRFREFVERQRGVIIPERYDFRRREKCRAKGSRGEDRYVYFAAWEAPVEDSSGRVQIQHVDDEGYNAFRARLVQEDVIPAPTEQEVTDIRERLRRREAHWLGGQTIKDKAAHDAAVAQLGRLEAAVSE